MSDEETGVAPDTSAETLPFGVGERLRNAREAKGMSIDQIAAKTRITNRHLELIEAGKFSALPGRTYAIGFTKNYARVVGEDEEAAATEVREHFAMEMPETGSVDRSADFEPGDPGKVPSAGLAWMSVLAVILLGVGGYAFYNSYYGTGASPGDMVDEAVAALTPEDAGEDSADGEEAAPASGPVVFTAMEDGIWVRFYDGSGNVLLEKQMAKSETWTVPEGAENPQIRTGRPDAFAITIGGQSVPILDPEPRVVSDIGISAEALLARGAEEAPVDADGAEPAG
ncbi:MAG: RodZ domain-containing protein [Erythrobacter sp.]